MIDMTLAAIIQQAAETSDPLGMAFASLREAATRSPEGAVVACAAIVAMMKAAENV